MKKLLIIAIALLSYSAASAQSPTILNWKWEGVEFQTPKSLTVERNDVEYFEGEVRNTFFFNLTLYSRANMTVDEYIEAIGKADEAEGYTLITPAGEFGMGSIEGRYIEMGKDGVSTIYYRINDSLHEKIYFGSVIFPSTNKEFALDLLSSFKCSEVQINVEVISPATEVAAKPATEETTTEVVVE